MFFYRRWRRDVGPWRWSSINAVMCSPDSRRSFRLMAGSTVHANREPPPHTYSTKSCSEIRANHPLSQMSMQTHAAVWGTDVWAHMSGLWVHKAMLFAEIETIGKMFYYISNILYIDKSDIRLMRVWTWHLLFIHINISIHYDSQKKESLLAFYCSFLTEIILIWYCNSYKWSFLYKVNCHDSLFNRLFH